MTLTPIAAILTGGRSTRFGAPKAAVAFGGIPSLDRIRTACGAVVETVVTIGGLGADVPDLEPGGGPLQAILAALREFPGRDVLVVACDVPLVTPAWLARIAAPRDRDVDMRVPRVAGRAQPLVALWGASTAVAVEVAWARGQRAVMPLLAALRVAWLEVAADAEDAADALALSDFDTPADAARLETTMRNRDAE